MRFFFQNFERNKLEKLIEKLIEKIYADFEKYIELKKYIGF